MASKSLLTSIAGRNAVLGGITAGTVSRAECEYHMLVDNEKRPSRVDVVVEHRMFSSITSAAEYLFNKQYSKYNMSAAEIYNAMCSLRTAIAYKCNKENTLGYYWG